MKKIFVKKYNQTKLNNLLNLNNMDDYHIPLYDNFDSFKNEYSKNLKEYLKYNPTEDEYAFIGENLFNKYDKYKVHPLDFKFTLSERKYGTFIDVQFDTLNLSNILREAIKNYILRCYKRKIFLFPPQLINWDETVTHKGNNVYIVHYEKITNEVLKILLERMMSINSELYLTDLSRKFLHSYAYIENKSIKFDYSRFIKNEYIEYHKIAKFLINRAESLQASKKKENILKIKYKNPQKLALLQELGFFDLPIFTTLGEAKANEITGILLDADPKEFVYKNRLNLKSKSPNYQIEKYTSYQYLEEMKRLISNTD
ncbi:hypothetical protein [Chryseobacterium sp. G0201]|uniref:hypothetical protein n=1 Tax=Chryseobacterium sp. G0201 TaxID=2487065 RepID=UPI000F4DC93C|nr:hypothetical protein [Chryseobacterium sp. G0201]AZA52061.1 hypothetical protein EG348_03090 [Chryseobacterium sp. G0201]